MRDIIRWDPFRDLFALRAEMDRLLARVPGPGESSLPRGWAPASDVVETDDAIVITAELPGVKDEDVAITVENGVLRISGERRLEHETDDDRYHRLERSYGGFERTFPLPPGVNEDDINAGIAYGVLKISIPKPTATEPKRIAINPAGDSPARPHVAIAPETGHSEERLLTADGRSVAVRPTRADDRERITALMDGLSPGSRAMRFGAVRPGLRQEEAAAIAAPPGLGGVGLIALAGADCEEAVAVARYDRRPGEPEAELSLAVADAWQGHGVGTGLIERLIAHARRDGLDALWALVLPANHRMREVFRNLGCELEEEAAPGELIVRLSTSVDDGLEDAAIARFARSAAMSLEPIMRPSSIAVVGASRDPESVGGAVLQALLEGRSSVSVGGGEPLGHRGRRPPGLAVPVGPGGAGGPRGRGGAGGGRAGGRPRGGRARRPRPRRPLVGLLRGRAGRSGARGRAGARRARDGDAAGGAQLPRRVERRGEAGFDATFAPAAPPQGAIALASQSGGLGLAAFAHCARRGVGLSAFVSLGNAADVSATDLLAWWERDERTRVVLLYLEGFGDARRFARWPGGSAAPPRSWH